MGWRLAPACVLLAALAAAGCTTLADRIVEPHGRQAIDDATVSQMLRKDGIERRAIMTPQGLRISYLDIPAADRGFEFHFQRNIRGSEVASRFNWHTAHAPRTVPERGTVVLLHGWLLDATTMVSWGEAFAGDGYRGIAIDLRNFGHSARAPVGFGTREARDVVAVLDVLRAHDRLQPPVFLFGVSYGAATALFAEHALRGRIAGIIALETFGNAAEAIRDMAREERSGPAHGLARLARAWARWRYDQDAVGQAIAQAGDRLHLDLSQVDTGKALAASQTCTLLLHGARDRLVPVATARGLARAAPAIRYTELPDEYHLTLPLRLDWLHEPLLAWMQAAATDRCMPLALPPDPVRPAPAATARAAGRR